MGQVGRQPHVLGSIKVVYGKGCCLCQMPEVKMARKFSRFSEVLEAPVLVSTGKVLAKRHGAEDSRDPTSAVRRQSARFIYSYAI